MRSFSLLKPGFCLAGGERHKNYDLQIARCLISKLNIDFLLIAICWEERKCRLAGAASLGYKRVLNTIISYQSLEISESSLDYFKSSIASNNIKVLLVTNILFLIPTIQISYLDRNIIPTIDAWLISGILVDATVDCSGYWLIIRALHWRCYHPSYLLARHRIWAALYLYSSQLYLHQYPWLENRNILSLIPIWLWKKPCKPAIKQ